MDGKYCPVCDSKLNKINYCRLCKRLIRNPVYMKTDFYLNESHPQGEQNCEYHGVSDGRRDFQRREKTGEESKRKEKIQGAKNQAAKNWSAYGQAAKTLSRINLARINGEDIRKGSGKKNGKKSPYSQLWTLIICFIIYIIFSIVAHTAQMWSSFF